MLGAPTSEEDRPPGKLWRYRDGQCTLVVQLYPDVQTRQFGTLAYEVKSDDNTDEGKRVCTAHSNPAPRPAASSDVEKRIRVAFVEDDGDYREAVSAELAVRG